MNDAIRHLATERYRLAAARYSMRKALEENEDLDAALDLAMQALKQMLDAQAASLPVPEGSDQAAVQ